IQARIDDERIEARRGLDGHVFAEGGDEPLGPMPKRIMDRADRRVFELRQLRRDRAAALAGADHAEAERAGEARRRYGRRRAPDETGLPVSLTCGLAEIDAVAAPVRVRVAVVAGGEIERADPEGVAALSLGADLGMEAVTAGEAPVVLPQ